MELQEKNQEKPKNSSENQVKETVHRVLAHSYSFFLFLFLLAVFLDTVFPIRIFESTYMVPIGLSILVFASLLILWAQKTSRDLQTQNLNKETFSKGPYVFTRSPTHWGLFFLIFGFGIIANAVYIIIFSVISFFITKLIFLKKEEEILADKYGAPYLEYKKSVKL